MKHLYLKIMRIEFEKGNKFKNYFNYKILIINILYLCYYISVHVLLVNCPYFVVLNGKNFRRFLGERYQRTIDIGSEIIKIIQFT